MDRTEGFAAYRPLGAFRLFLALLVVLQHDLQWVFPGALQSAVMPWAPGGAAVLVFFVVSGFVIVEAIDRFYAGRPAAFFVNRLARIFPLYVVAVLVSWGVLCILANWWVVTDQQGVPAPGDALGVGDLVRNILAILPLPGRLSIEPSFKLLQIAWALRVEMAFYGFSALLVLAAGVASRRFGGRDRARRMFAVFAAVAAVASLTAFFYYVLRRPPWNVMIEFVPEFCAGGAFYFALGRSRIAGAILAAALLGCGVAILRSQPSAEAQGDGLKVALLFLVLLAIGAMLVLRGRFSARLLRLDKLLGDYSYPVYVGHWLPILVFTTWRLAMPQPAGDLSRWLAVLCGLILPVAYFLAVEPAIKRFRDRVRGRPLDPTPQA